MTGPQYKALAQGSAVARSRAAAVRLGPALVLALMINGVLFGLATVLTQERPLPQDMSEPMAVNLIRLRPPRPREEETLRKPPEPPPPEQRPDFVPETLDMLLTAPDAIAISVRLDPDLMLDTQLRGDFIFEESDLDQPPIAVARIHPVYPYRARQRNVEGTVTIRILVRADGSIGEVRILEANPKGYFEDAVLKTVPRWRFKPGRIAGQSVAAWVVTNVVFDLSR